MSHPNFTWDHAEAAEPKLLAEKVLSLINDKNLFIGICTRKKLVINPPDIRHSVLRKDFATALKSAFYPKTSDWIIQEIGLAIGKGLEIILLIEAGVRKPKPEWTRNNYQIGYMMAIDVQEADAQAISDAYLATEDAGQADNRNSWIAFCEFVRLRFGHGGSLQHLKDLAIQQPHSPGVLSYLARAHETYQDYAAAAGIYEAAAKEAAEVGERLRLLKAAAVAHGHAGGTSEASAVIKEIKQDFQNCGTGEVELLGALRELADLDKDHETAIVIMERIVNINPSDNDTRFSLAYKYSQIDSNDLALFHYLTIPFGERTSMAWNNMGVAFGLSGLPAKSIDDTRDE